MQVHRSALQAVSIFFIALSVADGSEPVGSTPEAFRQYLLADLAKWAKLVKENGAKLD